MIEYVFWFCLALVVYSYVLYPIVLLLLSAFQQILRDTYFVLKGESKRATSLEDEDLPSIAVIISAFNEEAVIEERIKNLIDLDYPREKIRYLIGSDGSQDKTAEIINNIDDDCLEFYDFQTNRGKASVLNDLVSRTDAEVLVFSDANTHFESSAVRRLARHFYADSPIDAVCGELFLVDAESGDNEDGAYWKYERVLKFNESRVGGLLGANGAIYALKRCIYTPLSDDTVVDDFTVIFKVSVDGGKVIYDPEARAIEEVAPSTGEEYKRRIRIGSGNYQAFHRFLPALIPFQPVLWFTYLSHKVFRWFTPHALLLAFLCSLGLSFSSSTYFLLFLSQCFVYGGSVFFRERNINFAPLRLVVFWVNMNISLGLGAIRYYRGGVKGTWDSTKR